MVGARSPVRCGRGPGAGDRKSEGDDPGEPGRLIGGGADARCTVTARIAAAAEQIAAARLSHAPLAMLPEEIRPRDEPEAYAVQQAVHARLPDLGSRVGTKIACTTAVMQTYLGVHNPCSAGVFAGGTYLRSTTLSSGGFHRIGVECEIAVRIGHDLDPAQAPFTTDTVAEAITEYMAAIEIVDDRYADWRATDTPTLIADDFFAAGCVLGDPVARRMNARNLIGTTTVNGKEVGRGQGTDVMGDPLNALAWLAGSLALRGEMLRRGDIVLTGSLVETRWLSPGDSASALISGLGEVSLSVE
ncbi:MAG: hydratase [Hyphomicrobiales bacterium]|nr:hydratase [Hyphomicrobiales bacterium]